LDQDGNPVRNAVVGLYNEEGFNTGFASLVSDLNGRVEFARVPSGDYKAFAFKGSSSGRSDVQHFSQRAADQTILTVVIIAGDGIVRANVRDKEGRPMQFAEVAFVDALTLKAVGGGGKPVLDANGTVEIETRADKRVYLVARKEGYATFTTIVKPVIAGTTQVFDIVLEREIIQGEIEIEFTGLYKNGGLAKGISPGYEYDALFKLRVPSNKNYDSIGMHVRTGKNESMELDRIILKEINAPGHIQVIKATSYSPANGYSLDSEHLSTGDAKWANIKWPVFSSGITEVSARIMVKETANLGDQLNMFYRAWGEERNNYKRNPLDAELGEAESVIGKEGLYANAKQELFQLDVETLCDGKFCFSASILDKQEEISHPSPDGFQGRVFRPYRLSFTILNDSASETDSYLDAEVRLSGQDSSLQLQAYRIYGAQNQESQGNASGESTDWIEIGNFLPNNRAAGWIDFVPQKSGSSQLVVEVRSGQRIRFSKAISMEISSNREMTVLVSPEMLPSVI